MICTIDLIQISTVLHVLVCVWIQFHAILSHVYNGGTATTSRIENRSITRSPCATLLWLQPLCFLRYSITQVATNLFFISIILSCWEYYIDGLLWYISFWDFFFSPILSLLRSFQVFTCINSHSFLLLSIIPSYGYTTTCLFSGWKAFGLLPLWWYYE